MVQDIGLDKLIKEHPFFEGLGDAALEFIAGCAANERYDEGEYIFREGQPADKFYVVRHGTVALEVRAPGLEPIMLATLEEGEIIGFSWLIPPFRWGWDARAMRLSRLVSFDAICLRSKLDSDPELGYALYKRFARVLSERLSATRIQLLDLYGAAKKSKAADRRG
jgi:CRP/FNR family transcriptional regulator, cyclic AMP receptor protein